MLEQTVAGAIVGFARLLTGVQARWLGCRPVGGPRVYIANHTSHLDFILVWASLPPDLRPRTRPVAGADYWERGQLRRYLIHEVFRGVLVERGRMSRQEDPLAPLVEALDYSESLIFFPEGTRTLGDEMLPFKSGIFHLARRCPAAEIVPVWINNLARVLPKGEVFPVPLLCTLTFGAPLRLEQGEEKAAFLSRARQAVADLGRK
jgi:1-acyl-sn-glycerol-3-phosphate acyltransferase